MLTVQWYLFYNVDREGGIVLHKDDHWAFTIKRIHETVRKHTNSRLSRYNLTVSQIRVLMNLYDTPTKQMSMKEYIDPFMGTPVKEGK